jgi:hypothetical protein
MPSTIQNSNSKVRVAVKNCVDVLSYSHFETMIFSGLEESKNSQNSLYLTNYVFRKTYVSIQKTIDDWLRKIVHGDISVSELKWIKSQKSFNRSSLREIKNPRNLKT